MGQTLTHGIYLPDEGERNCYNGLAGNWQLLDGAVGTVAEHTNQIAGKAPLVHTHTKADITDLFNSANVWTNTQTYSADSYGDKIKLKNTGLDLSVNGNTGLSSAYQHIISWVDKNETAYSLVQSWTNNSENVLVLRSRYRTDANTVKDLSVRFTSTATDKVVYPESNGDTNLGTSTKQWNNLYAKNYYYNGVAWGLDQANVWTGRQTYGAYLKSFGEARTDEWSSNSRTNAYLLSRRDTDDVSGFLISTFRSNQAQGTAGHIYGWDILENSTRYSGLRFTIDWDSTLNSGNGAYKVTLGTNTQGTNPCNDLHITQLKTINGINPGALSLPSATTSAIDVTNWVTNSWTANYCDAPFDGYISISCFANSLQINNETKAYGMTFQPGDDGFVCGLMPVCSGDHIKVAFVKTQTSIFEGYKFIKANGNV